MNLQNDLFNIIKSLNKSEKGYIKKFSARHQTNPASNYLKLFKEIEKQADKNRYDEILLKQKFSDKKFTKNFPVAKSYLYETVLRSLNSYYAYSNKDNELKEKVRNIEVLYKKALYPQCLRLLKRTKGEAGRYDNFNQLLELIKWERNLIHEGALQGDVFKNLTRTYEEEKEILTKIQNLSDYRMLSFSVQETIRKEMKEKQVEEFLLNPLLQNVENALSYPAKLNFYHIRAAVFEEMKNSTEAYQERLKIVEQMEKFPEKIKEYRVNYLISLYNLTNSCYRLKLYDEFTLNLKKLRSIPEKVSKGISENMQVLMFIGPATLELKMLIDRGVFSEGIGAAEEIQKGLLKFKNKMHPRDEFTCLYYLAYIYFGAGDYPRAIQWLNKILNSKVEAHDIASSAMILNLILHYDLKNFELLEYLIKSAYRRLKKQKDLNELEQELIRFLRKIPNLASQNELNEAFKETKEKVSKILPREGSLQFDFESWLESKITGKKFADIIKEKHLGKIPAN